MLTAEQNDRLTQVGPGTPMGALLRRYWHPVTTLSALRAEPLQPVRLLGEDLVLYQTEAGALGLIQSRCPHRGASMLYGIPEEDGLRCPYHGWKFAPSGQCIEQPAEGGDSTFAQRVRVSGYPVQAVGGLVFAYLGPEPVPLVPRWDVLVRPDVRRDVGMALLPCNWLQIQENSLDPHHVDYLHNRLTNYVRRRQGLPPARVSRKTRKVAFDVFEYGIMKRRLWEGDDEDSPEWTVGHAMVFPNGTLLPGTPPEAPHFQWRVPVDDTHTLYLWYNCRLAEADTPPQAPEDIPLWENAFQHPNGRYIVETVSGQDMMAWITQGPIADRTNERLGTSDKGIVLFRQMLAAEMAKVERGEDPMGTIRDPARNESIYIPREERYPSRHASTVDYRSLQFARRELAATR